MDKISINKNEVLRYLGYKGQELDTDLEERIESLIKDVNTKINPRVVLEKYNIKFFQDKVMVIGTELVLQGEDIKKCLDKCDEVYLLAVTLGIEMEKMIRLAQASSILDALILDSIATAYVEAVCDKIEDDIYKDVKRIGKGISFRFSPGYGDLPIKTQKYFLKTIDAQRRLGLTLSSSLILIPRKSVTAIIGVKNEIVKKINKSCNDCPNCESCKFRKDGECYGA